MSSSFPDIQEKINQTETGLRVLCVAHTDFDLGAHIVSIHSLIDFPFSWT